MRIGTPITATRHDGTTVNGTFAGQCAKSGTGIGTPKVLLRRADGQFIAFRKDQITHQIDSYGQDFDAEAYFKGEIERVFAEFTETVGRPPTLRELKAWLPGAWVVPLARKMGMEVRS